MSILASTFKRHLRQSCEHLTENLVDCLPSLTDNETRACRELKDYLASQYGAYFDDDIKLFRLFKKYEHNARSTAKIRGHLKQLESIVSGEAFQ